MFVMYFSFEERLRERGLTILERSRSRGGLIEEYKTGKKALYIYSVGEVL